MGFFNKVFGGQKARADELADEGLFLETGKRHDRHLRIHTCDIDLDKAISLYKKSCQMGSGFGCYLLAELYRKGKGVEQDSVMYAQLMADAKDYDPVLISQIQEDEQKSLTEVIMETTRPPWGN